MFNLICVYQTLEELALKTTNNDKTLSGKKPLVAATLTQTI